MIVQRHDTVWAQVKKAEPPRWAFLKDLALRLTQRDSAGMSPMDRLSQQGPEGHHPSAQARDRRGRGRVHAARNRRHTVYVGDGVTSGQDAALCPFQNAPFTLLRRLPRHFDAKANGRKNPRGS